MSDPRGQRLFSPAPVPPTRRVSPAEHALRARRRSAVLLMCLRVTSTPNCQTPPEHGNKALHALKKKRDRLLDPRPPENQPRLAVPHALGGAGEELSPGMPPRASAQGHRAACSQPMGLAATAGGPEVTHSWEHPGSRELEHERRLQQKLNPDARGPAAHPEPRTHNSWEFIKQ